MTDMTTRQTTERQESVDPSMATSTREPRRSMGVFDLRRWRKLQPAAWLAGLVVLLVFPQIADASTVTIAVFTLVFAAAGSAWNIFSGYTGYIALGHAVFFGLGAYTLALIGEHLHVPGGYGLFAWIPVAGLVAMIFAAPLGLIALRTRRHTFVVITIAFLFIFQLLAYNLRSITAGSAGIEYPLPPWFGDFFNLPFYYVAAAILVVAVAVSWFVRHSKYGLELLAIRDDEDRALGLGVRTTFAKLSSFMLSAFFVGMCGAVFGYYLGSIYPNTGFDPNFDVLVALTAFLGGLGTIAGPLVGAAILIPLQQELPIWLHRSDLVSLYLVVFGCVFLLVVLVLPQGIVPALTSILRRRGSGATTPVAPPAGQTAGPAPAPARLPEDRSESAPAISIERP